MFKFIVLFKHTAHVKTNNQKKDKNVYNVGKRKKKQEQGNFKILN